MAFSHSPMPKNALLFPLSPLPSPLQIQGFRSSPSACRLVLYACLWKSLPVHPSSRHRLQTSEGCLYRACHKRLVDVCTYLALVSKILVDKKWIRHQLLCGSLKMLRCFGGSCYMPFTSATLRMRTTSCSPVSCKPRPLRICDRGTSSTGVDGRGGCDVFDATASLVRGVAFSFDLGARVEEAATPAPSCRDGSTLGLTDDEEEVVQSTGYELDVAVSFVIEKRGVHYRADCASF